MSRTNLSFIEQVLSKTSIPVTIDFIHNQCEVVAGRPLSRQTIKRELSRITCEESFKFSWIKRSAKGLYEYVSQDKRSIENFSNESDVSEVLIAKVEAVDEAAANFLRSKAVTKIIGFSSNTELLNEMFLWTFSPQGFEYWENINDQIDKNDQSQKFVVSQSDVLTITIPKHIKKLEILIK